MAASIRATMARVTIMTHGFLKSILISGSRDSPAAPLRLFFTMQNPYSLWLCLCWEDMIMARTIPRVRDIVIAL